MRSPTEGVQLRNTLNLLLGIAVSLGCLYLATRGTDWPGVAAVLRGARPFWVLAISVVGLVSLTVRAQRWRLLLRPLGDVPLAQAISATAIGFGASAVLPLRLGELVRPALLSRRCGTGLSATISSVVLERIFDMLLVVVCFLAVGLIYPLPSSLGRAAVALGLGLMLALVAFVLMLRHRHRAEMLVERWLPVRAARAVGPLLHGFLAGLGGLADAGTVFGVLGLSAVVWGVIALGWACAFLALGVDVPLAAAALTTMVTVAAFVFLPQGPGFVGTWQAGCVLALGLFGVQKDVAVGFSLLSWITMVGTNLLAGAVFLAREDLSLRQLLGVAERERPAA